MKWIGQLHVLRLNGMFRDVIEEESTGRRRYTRGWIMGSGSYEEMKWKAREKGSYICRRAENLKSTFFLCDLLEPVYRCNFLRLCTFVLCRL